MNKLLVVVLLLALIAQAQAYYLYYYYPNSYNNNNGQTTYYYYPNNNNNGQTYYYDTGNTGTTYYYYPNNGYNSYYPYTTYYYTYGRKVDLDGSDADPICKTNRTSSCELTKRFFGFIGVAWCVIFLFGFLVGPKTDVGFYKDFFIHHDPHVDFEGIPPLPCEIEPWNQINTTSFPFHDLHKSFAKQGMTGSEGLSDGQLRLMSAFLYEEYIAVTHSAQDPKGVNRKAYCHYYDCHRQEIPGSVFESFVFPMTAVQCPRRAGAKYMSLTFSEQDVPQEPIPLINRILKNPPHEVGVCVGQIYGTERRWLEIIEFVEHHKLMGATMFYFTILEMDGYSKKTIEDYERLGEIEATIVNTEYEKLNWLFHMIQVHECFFRSKFHSKWVIHVDIDERLTMTSMPLVSYLRQQPPEVCELNFGGRRVQKHKNDPDTYESDAQIRSELIFLRYNVTSAYQWGAFKSVFRPDKIHMIFFHWTSRQHEGCIVKTAEKKIGYVRHYRTTDLGSLAGNWIPKIRPYEVTKLDPDFADKLKEQVIKKVKFLYEQHPVWCTSIDPWIRKTFPDDMHCT